MNSVCVGVVKHFRKCSLSRSEKREELLSVDKLLVAGNIRWLPPKARNTRGNKKIK